MPRKKLTDREEIFCVKFFELRNATEAARLAHYSMKYGGQNTWSLLRRPLIKARLNELLQKEKAVREIVEADSIMGVVERKQRLTEIARARLTDFMELGQDGSWVNIGKETHNSGAIQEIHSRTEYDEDGSKPTVHTSVKLHDPMKAIDTLNRMDKMYSDGNIVNLNQNIQNVEAKIVNFDAKAVARAILEAAKLGLVPAVFGGNGHGEDTNVLSSPADIQATAIPEPED